MRLGAGLLGSNFELIDRVAADLDDIIAGIERFIAR